MVSKLAFKRVNLRRYAAYAKMQANESVTRDLLQKVALLENDKREDRIRIGGLESQLSEAIDALKQNGGGDAALESEVAQLSDAVESTATKAEANHQHFFKIESTLASIEASADSAGKTATEAIAVATAKWDKGKAEVAELRGELEEVKRAMRAVTNAASGPCPPPRASEEPPALSAAAAAAMQAQQRELLERISKLEKALKDAGLDGLNDALAQLQAGMAHLAATVTAAGNKEPSKTQSRTIVKVRLYKLNPVDDP
jgi:chromosome segregation ATPase